MISVMISILPYWCSLILSGKKTIEARKTKPKIQTPFRCFIYETKKGIGHGKVIGEFVCDKIVWIIDHPTIFARHALLYEAAINAACLTPDEAEKYSNGADVFGWHISDLVIYNKPKELSEFNLARPPQSWCYVKEAA